MNNKPFEILTPDKRWAPGQAQLDAFKNKYEMLLAPLVHKVRKAVEEWRNSDYEGATETTKALLNHWLKWGLNAGRAGSVEFNPAIYLSRYVDLRAAFGSQNYYAATNHWLIAGRTEGRDGN